MKTPLRIASFGLLLLTANCGVETEAETAAPELATQQSSLFTATAAPVACNTPWGPVTVTVHHTGTYGAHSPCALFDGNTAQWATITYNGTARLNIDIQFPTKRTLTGFFSYVGGYNGYPSASSYIVTAACDEGALSFPVYRGLANRNTIMGFDGRCTTSMMTIGVNRHDGDGVEHIAELDPRFLDANEPTTGDSIVMLQDPSIVSCGASERLGGGSILSATTGAEVGRAQVWRAPCVQRPANTPVYVYYSRAVSSVGLPADMDLMSTWISTTDSTGATYRNNQSARTVWGPAGGIIQSNVVVVPAGSGIVSVTACGAYYDGALDTTANASGCSPAFGL